MTSREDLIKIIEPHVSNVAIWQLSRNIAESITDEIIQKGWVEIVEEKKSLVDKFYDDLFTQHKVIDKKVDVIKLEQIAREHFLGVLPKKIDSGPATDGYNYGIDACVKAIRER